MFFLKALKVFVKKTWLLLLGLLSLSLFLWSIWDCFALRNFFYGLSQSSGRPQLGGLPEAEFLRWRDADDDFLSYWIRPKAHFDHGFASGSLQFENSPGNNWTLVFELTLRQKDRARVIYRSPPVEPGYFLDGAKLGYPLHKGTYRVDCVVYAYETGGAEPCARSQKQEILVVVKN